MVHTSLPLYTLLSHLRTWSKFNFEISTKLGWQMGPLDGEHASPGRSLAPSTSSQRFLGLPPHNSVHLLKYIWNSHHEVKCAVIAKYKVQTPPLHHLPACWHDWEVRKRVNTEKTICNCIVWPKQFNFGQCQLKKRCRAHQRMIKIDRVPIWLPAASGLGNQTR